MQTIRTINAMILVPFMILTGFRFSKNYRWGVSRYHRSVYRLVNTVGANWKAGL